MFHLEQLGWMSDFQSETAEMLVFRSNETRLEASPNRFRVSSLDLFEWSEIQGFYDVKLNSFLQENKPKQF